MVILKSYKTLSDDSKYINDDAEELLYEYGEVLRHQGWTESILEGGGESPDGSTLFVVSRNPYKGQLLSLRKDLANEFNLIVSKMKESDDFIEC